MNTMKRMVFASTLLGLLLTTGCVKLWRDNLEIKTYMVEVGRSKVALEIPLANKLWIDTVSVLPPFNVRNLVLQKTDVEYETSYYAELLLSPSENFRNNLYTWFADSGIFHDVSMSERRGMSHRLAVSVLKFHGDASTSPGQAVLEIRATLIDEQGKAVRVLFSSDYREKVDVSEQSAEALIRAYNQALLQILSDCEDDVVEVLNKTK